MDAVTYAKAKKALQNTNNLLKVDTKIFYQGESIDLSDAVKNSPIIGTFKVVATQAGSGDPSLANIRAITGHTSLTVEATNGTDTDTCTITPTTALYGVDGTEDTIAINEYGAIVATHNTKKYTLNGTQAWSGHTRNAKGVWCAAVGVGVAVKAGSLIVANKLPSESSYTTTNRDSIMPAVGLSPLIALTDATTGLTAGSTVAEVTAAFNTFFTTNPTDIVFALATPTTQNITPPQIVSAMEGTTTITNSGNGGATLTYYVDSHSRIDDIQDYIVPEVTVQRPIVTFTNDDGIIADYTVLKPIIAEYNIPMTLYVSSSISGRMYAIQMRELQDVYGCEIGSHMKNHERLVGKTEAQITAELVDSKTALEALGLRITSASYPEGYHNALVRRLTKKYYKTGASGPLRNRKISTGAVACMDIPRIPLGVFPGTLPTPDYPTLDSLDFYKTLVDETVTKNGWIVFVLHAGNAGFTSEQQQIFKDLITYIQSINVEIMTLNDAFEVFGSYNEIGDCTISDKNNGLCISPNGSMNLSTKIFTKTETIENSGITSSTSILDFPPNCVSYTPCYQNANSGFPANSGVLVTDKSADNYSYWHQLFYSTLETHKAWRRRFVNGVPTDWEPLFNGSSSTANRPTLNYKGYMGFDETLGKPVFVKTAGVAEKDVLTLTSGATSSGNITITLNSVDVVVSVITGDTIADIETKIKAATFTGWAVSNTVRSGIIRFTKTLGGACSAPVFTDTDSTGVTGSFAVYEAGVTTVWIDATGATV